MMGTGSCLGNWGPEGGVYRRALKTQRHGVVFSIQKVEVRLTVPKTHQSYLNSWPHPIAGGSDSGLKAQESAFEKSFLVDPHAEKQCIDRHLGTPGLDR